jgi:hypothetical protein
MSRRTVTKLLQHAYKRCGTHRAVIVALTITALELAGAFVAFKALADDAMSTSCVRSYGARTCTTRLRYGPPVDPYARHLSALDTDREEAEVIERDRKWRARCRPVVVQDQYGVGRYHYAAAGCEFGKTE